MASERSGSDSLDLDKAPDADVRDLARHYRTLLQAQRKEAASTLQLLREARGEHDAFRSAQKKLQEQEETIRQLKSQLNDARGEANTQAEAASELRLDAQRLRAEVEEGARKLNLLLTDAGQTTQEAAFYRDRRPSASTMGSSRAASSAGSEHSSGHERPPPRDRSAPSLHVTIPSAPGATAEGRPPATPVVIASQLSQRARATGATTRSAGSPGHGHGGVIRIVYMPNAQVDALQETVEVLTRELDEHRRRSAARIAELTAGRSALAAEEESRLELVGAAKRAAAEAAGEKEAALRDTATELASARLELADVRQRLAEAERCGAHRLAVVRRAGEDALREALAATDAALRDGDVARSALRDGAAARAREAALVTEQGAAARQLWERRAEELSRRLSEARQRQLAAERRRRMDLEGMGRDVHALTVAVRRLETVTGVGHALARYTAAPAAASAAVSGCNDGGGGGRGKQAVGDEDVSEQLEEEVKLLRRRVRALSQGLAAPRVGSPPAY